MTLPALESYTETCPDPIPKPCTIKTSYSPLQPGSQKGPITANSHVQKSQPQQVVMSTYYVPGPS